MERGTNATECSIDDCRTYEPNLWGYTKDISQTPGISETVNIDHITRHYYVSHADLNPKRIVPTGPDIDFSESHDRDELSGEPPTRNTIPAAINAPVASVMSRGCPRLVGANDVASSVR